MQWLHTKRALKVSVRIPNALSIMHVENDCQCSLVTAEGGRMAESSGENPLESDWDDVVAPSGSILQPSMDAVSASVCSPPKRVPSKHGTDSAKHGGVGDEGRRVSFLLADRVPHSKMLSHNRTSRLSRSVQVEELLPGLCPGFFPLLVSQMSDTSSSASICTLHYICLLHSEENLSFYF